MSVRSPDAMKLQGFHVGRMECQCTSNLSSLHEILVVSIYKGCLILFL
ncbi:hypothetical protein U27_06486 [Candidatus Vecturithrix granuli]|uniref:Uncharacterized protein n=1 Tax=Vecturithrix granuli TaxID=1499967 RepID=A0A081C4J6_VECG1|nr:hypothetical protein U27_06486 [Candidatus Vecturithrix granuli]